MTEQVIGVKRALEDDGIDNTKSAALEKLRAENKLNHSKKLELMLVCKDIDERVEKAEAELKKVKEELSSLEAEQRVAHAPITPQEDGVYTKIRVLNVLEELAVSKEGHVIIVDDFDQMLAGCINDFFLDRENEIVTKHRAVFEMIRARFDYAPCKVTLSYSTKLYANRDSDRVWYPEPDIDVHMPCCSWKAIITDLDYEEILESNDDVQTDGGQDGLHDWMDLEYDATHLSVKGAQKTEVK
jgi:hypothetical protein